MTTHVGGPTQKSATLHCHWLSKPGPGSFTRPRIDAHRGNFQHIVNVIVLKVPDLLQMSTASISLQSPAEEPKSRRKSSALLGVVMTFIIDCIAGVVAWHLVSPGQTLIGPLLIVAMILAGPTIGWWFYLRSLPTSKTRRALSTYVAILLALPLLWTYFGVLPASVGFDWSAATIAQAEISSSAGGCQVVTRGSIGLLRAPYKVCEINESSSSLVFFATLDGYRGYAYVGRNQGLNWFPDECARHLEGHWWAYFSNPVAVVYGCPLGYSAHGGG